MSWVSAVNRCTTTRNAIIMPCTLTCPHGTYQITQCTIDRDTVCAACLQTPVGYVTTVQCTPTTDTTWAPCPYGMACFGGRNYSSCTPPRLVGNGRCVCPNATQADTDEAQCLPKSCSAGYYPDIDSDGCRACTAQGTLCHAILVRSLLCFNIISIFQQGTPPPTRWPE